VEVKESSSEEWHLNDGLKNWKEGKQDNRYSRARLA
jgi:hypothetical protein